MPYIARPTILIVDDDPSVLEALELLLETSFRTSTANSAESALTLLKTRYFQVVLVDITLPGRNGIHLLREIKQHWPTTEVIMVTADKSLEDALQCLSKGAFDYITKPWKNDEILKNIHHAAEKADLSRKVAILNSRLQPASTPQIVQIKSDLSPDARKKIGKICDLLIRESLETGSMKIKDAVQELEKIAIVKAMQENNWNQSVAAGVLGLHRNTLVKKMKEYRIPTAKQPSRTKAKR